MATVASMNRVFDINGMRISDPTPDKPLAESVRHLTHNYPILRHTQVLEEDGVPENGELVFTIHMPPVKTNG